MSTIYTSATLCESFVALGTTVGFPTRFRECWAFHAVVDSIYMRGHFANANICQRDMTIWNMPVLARFVWMNTRTHGKEHAHCFGPQNKSNKDATTL